MRGGTKRRKTVGDQEEDGDERKRIGDKEEEDVQYLFYRVEPNSRPP
jgi:hypothetical protein